MQQFFATCPKGLEYLLRDELVALGAREVHEALSGVHFSGELVDAYRLIEPSLQRLRRSRDRRDEPAHIYDPRAFMAADG